MDDGIQVAAKSEFSSIKKGQQVVYYVGNLAKDRGMKTEKQTKQLTEQQQIVDDYADYWSFLEMEGKASLVQKKVGNKTLYIAQKRK